MNLLPCIATIEVKEMGAIATFELKGSREALQQAITDLMVYNAEFRGIINRAGLEANKVRNSKQN